MICLPELCITGYGCEDAFFYPHVQQLALDTLFSLKSTSKGMAVAVGLPVFHQGVLFNCIALLVDQELVGFVPKKFLAGDGVHYEPRWFRAWKPGEVSEFVINGRSYPFGDLYFDLNGIRIGFEICEEAWVAQRPGIHLALRGVDIILNPSASHFAFGKLTTRKRFVCEGSRSYHVGYVYSNLLGNESGSLVFDGAVLIADQGEILNQSPRFSYQDCQVISAVIDIQRNRLARTMSASFCPDFTAPCGQCIRVGFSLSAVAPEMPTVAILPWEKSDRIKEEEFTRAVSLALFDFIRKSSQHGFVVSLSGGIDSAAVTLLCRTAIDLAIAEIGLNGFKHKLSHIPGIEHLNDADELAKFLISTAYQATQNSSTTTQRAAQRVAADAGATFYQWNVDSILSLYQQIAESALGEPLTWAKHDLSLQNIQARVRGPSIWMIANMKQALLLATSNRSEAAVGYATMDGDTCGGLSPLGGIDKDFLRTWARWMADYGPNALRSFPSMQDVLSQPPTAELRPKEHQQTDEGDLMPYEILEAIEQLAIGEKRSPQETFAQLRITHASYGTNDLLNWTVKFFRLWCRSQWKRERYAPGIHVDDRNLDPRSWCRFPTLSSGFAQELSTLTRLLDQP